MCPSILEMYRIIYHVHLHSFIMLLSFFDAFYDIYSDSVSEQQWSFLACAYRQTDQELFSPHIEGWAQDYSNSNIFLKPLFRGNLDPFVNNANLGAIAHTSNGT